MKYSEKLKDPRWQKKRLEIFQRDNFTCIDCMDTTKTLHVHHLDYISGNDPWEYPNEYLVTLCHECHDFITNYRPQIEKEIIAAFRIKMKGSFHMQCVQQVFNKFEDLKELFFMISEMLDKQEDVKDSLRTTMFSS